MATTEIVSITLIPAVAYARISTNAQNHSIQHQLNGIRVFALREVMRELAQYKRAVRAYIDGALRCRQDYFKVGQSKNAFLSMYRYRI